MAMPCTYVAGRPAAKSTLEWLISYLLVDNDGYKRAKRHSSYNSHIKTGHPKAVALGYLGPHAIQNARALYDGPLMWLLRSTIQWRFRDVAWWLGGEVATQLPSETAGPTNHGKYMCLVHCKCTSPIRIVANVGWSILHEAITRRSPSISAPGKRSKQIP